MAASSAGPLAVGVMAEGTGAGAQTATNRKRHRLNQRTGHLAIALVRIAVLLIVEPLLHGLSEESSHNDSSLEGKPTALLFCGCPVADVSLTSASRQWTIVMRTRKGGGAARSFCRAFAYCPHAKFRSCWLMASQNVVSTCAGEGVRAGNAVADGEGTEVGESPP
jgi:hypothetical protein